MKVETAVIDLTFKDEEPDSRAELEAVIDSSDKTSFQKRCLKALLQIPPGQVSTYGNMRFRWLEVRLLTASVGAMSNALKSSPRAVGNAMRGNPFAPMVPCHRILAADRSIGGESSLKLES